MQANIYITVIYGYLFFVFFCCVFVVLCVHVFMWGRACVSGILICMCECSYLYYHTPAKIYLYFTYTCVEIEQSHTQKHIQPSAEKLNTHILVYCPLPDSLLLTVISLQLTRQVGTAKLVHETNNRTSCAAGLDVGWCLITCNPIILTAHYGEYPDIKEICCILCGQSNNTKYGKFATMMIRPNGI